MAISLSCSQSAKVGCRIDTESLCVLHGYGKIYSFASMLDLLTIQLRHLELGLLLFNAHLVHSLNSTYPKTGRKTVQGK